MTSLILCDREILLQQVVVVIDLELGGLDLPHVVELGYCLIQSISVQVSKVLSEHGGRLQSALAAWPVALLFVALLSVAKVKCF